MKKRRKLSYPVLEEEWGVRERRDTSRAGRGPPSLAGGNSETKDQVSRLEYDEASREGLTPLHINLTTSHNTTVDGGEVVDGAAPHTTLELRRSNVPSLRQTLITESFHKPAHLSLAGRDDDDGLNLHMEITPCVTLGEEDESGMKAGSTDVLVTSKVCEGVQPVTSMTNIEGMNTESVCNVAIMKDDVSETMLPSVVEDENCVYKRGVCVLHKMKGVKYTMVEKKWKDRGGGKGYGYVTSKKVRYRCEVKNLPRTSSSLTEYDEEEGTRTCGEY